MKVCIVIHNPVAWIKDNSKDPEWWDECIRDGLESRENGSGEEGRVDYDELRSATSGTAWREVLKIPSPNCCLPALPPPSPSRRAMYTCGECVPLPQGLELWVAFQHQ